MLSSATRFRARGTVVLSLFVLAVIVAACGGAAQLAGAPGPAATGAPALPVPGLDGEQGEDAGNGNNDGSGDGRSLAGGPTAPEGLLIIKTGEIAIQVGGLDPALASANQLIVGIGGYSSGSERFGDGDDAQASVTYRVPAARWDEALAGLRGLAEKVLDRALVDAGRDLPGRRSGRQDRQPAGDRARPPGDHGSRDRDQGRPDGPGGADEDPQRDRAADGAEARGSRGRPAFSTVTVTFALKPDPILAEQKGFDAGDRSRAGLGQPRLDPPGPRHGGHLVRDRLAADPADTRADHDRRRMGLPAFPPDQG